MKPLSVKIEGYRRFGAPNQALDLRGELIALVGPNEAGKSSLLQALKRIEDDDPLEPDDLTRGGDGSVKIAVTYGLDQADSDALAAHFPSPWAQEVRRVVVEKYEDGSRGFSVVESLTKARSLIAAPLQRLTKTLEGATDDVHYLAEIEDLVEALTQGKMPTAPDTKLFEYALAVAADEQASAEVREVGQALGEVLRFAYVRPGAAIARWLWSRTPGFLMFDTESRDLRSAYTISASARGEWNDALHNLAKFAGLDLDRLQAAVGNVALVDSLLDGPNQALERKVQQSWRQSRVTIRLRMEGQTLHIQARDAGQGNVLPISARSDGLRQFVALTAFVAAHRAAGDEIRPVLLIDEAEQHLHYDAQADLINVLVAQQDVSKVIYSTHSAGCLPPDLGTGVRALVPYRSPNTPADADPDLTRPLNNIWAGQSIGYDPLLLAMGAGTFALTAARRAVVSEGFTDVLLLPTLVREATEVARLEYQVVLGIAVTPDDQLALLSEVAINVAYLVDGDDPGYLYKDKLVAAGVSKDNVIAFCRKNSRGAASPEDIIRPAVFVDAVNEILHRSGLPPMSVSGIPRRGRWAAVRAWVAQHGGTSPSKKELALELLERRHDGLLDAGGRERIRSIDLQLRKALELLPPPPPAE
jgi:predicted ATP-dependent endonuclease of OLD family